MDLHGLVAIPTTDVAPFTIALAVGEDDTRAAVTAVANIARHRASVNSAGIRNAEAARARPPGVGGRRRESPSRCKLAPAGNTPAARFYAARVGLRIEEFQPAPALRGVVHRIADFRERSAPLRRLEAPLIGVVMIVSLGPDMEIDGCRCGSFVAGVWDRPTVTGHYGEQAGYQLYLDPLASRRLLGVPASELANRLVALDDVLGPFAAELTERLAAAPDATERHAVAQRLLTTRLSEAAAAPPEVVYAFARLRATRGAVAIQSLATEVGWSRRHLAARVREVVGLPPKALARLIRVEHAAQRVRAGDPLADVAYQSGYADQAHFNRDFRELVGCTPTEFPFVQDTPTAA
jgi:AraC-like DNA-binding protein